MKVPLRLVCTIDYLTEEGNYSPTALVHRNSAGKNGLYKMRLECGDNAKVLVTGHYYEVSVMLDNIAPTLYTFGGTPTPLPVIESRTIWGAWTGWM